MIHDLEAIRLAYGGMRAKIEAARAVFGRPLTLAEKVLAAHVAEPLEGVPERRQSYALLHPDRVAMQDATAQMALLQFMRAGRRQTALPTTVHCDHLIRAEIGAKPDLERALEENNEVYAFLKNTSKKYGIGFWKPGSGIIHQVILEKYAFPGGLMIGTDSHSPNAGGLGMFAVGVGGADAVDAMAGLPWELQWPSLIGVKLTGQLSGWASPKDLIVKLAGILTVKGGTGHVLEYFGKGVAALSCTGRATVANMGAEVGATTSIFPFDERAAAYLKATDREEVAALAAELDDLLTADPETAETPEDYYDEIVEIDLDKLEPHLAGPFTPDLVRPLSSLKAEAADKDYPDQLKAVLIGSCTNSSYEDIGRAAHVAKQALDQGLKVRSDLLITPGSEQVRATIERDGLLETLSQAGAKVLANACGPCIGQWRRIGVEDGEKNSIVTTFNRNFAKRNDGNPATLAFIGSPEIAMAMALAGSLTFDPARDQLLDEQGREVTLAPPAADDLPAAGFAAGADGYEPPADDPESVVVQVDRRSERLQLLKPFRAWDGEDMIGLLLLLKAKGKCTTDHISPAGPWLRFRGHLDHISDNMFSGATNAFADEPGRGNNLLTGQQGEKLHETARCYKAEGHGWAVVGDENYGEGSSREHAAMSPRHLGCRVVIARSFARIHETNLKKQGILPLTFANPADYDKIQEGDRMDVIGLADLAPGKALQMRLRRQGGEEDVFEVRHSLWEVQLEWFKAGSALNAIAAAQEQAEAE